MAFGRRETALLIVGDFICLAISLWIALILRNLALPAIRYFEFNLIPFIPIFCLSLIIFYIAGLYEKQTRPTRSVMSLRIFGAQVANILIAAVLFFLLPLSIAPKTILIIYLGVSTGTVSLWRFYRLSREIATVSRVPLVLVGSGSAVQELYEEVNGNGSYLIRFSGLLDPSLDHLTKALREELARGTEGIVLDTTDALIAKELPNFYQLISPTLVFRDFASLYEEIFDRVPLAHLSIERVFEVLPGRQEFYDPAKRGFDIALALIASLIALPVILLGALFVSLSGGSPFIVNERVGKGNAVIRIFKLRTMLFNDRGDPELRAKNHVTTVGKVLRKSRIDELPQLLNVLMGDLSFIGPRPELPALAQEYERAIPYYEMRHLTTPGLSGWAQIHDYDAPKGGLDIERTKKKLSFDLYYLKHRSFGLDLTIALKTLRALFSFSGT